MTAAELPKLKFKIKKNHVDANAPFNVLSMFTLSDLKFKSVIRFR